MPASKTNPSSGSSIASRLRSRNRPNSGCTVEDDMEERQAEDDMEDSQAEEDLEESEVEVDSSDTAEDDPSNINKRLASSNKNLRKSGAYAKKTREDIQEGVRGELRRSRLEEKKKKPCLVALVKEALRRVSRRAELIEEGETFRGRLMAIASDESHTTPHEEFFIRVESDEGFHDWMDGFLEFPYTTSPPDDSDFLLRQATKTDAEASTEGIICQVYIRYYETTTADEQKRLEGFLQAYPGYEAQVQTKLKLLSKLNELEIIYVHYIGQTIAGQPVDRLLKDYGTNQKTFLTNYLRHTGLKDLVAYEVLPLRTVLIAEPKQDIAAMWLRAGPKLWDLEYGMVQASGAAAYNSATGGMPYKNFLLPLPTRDILAATMHAPARESVDESTATADIQQQIRQQIVSHFQEMVNAFKEKGRSVVSKAAVRHGVDLASNVEVILEEPFTGGQAANSRPYTTLSLLLAKDITRHDSKGDTNYWDSPSGKLWEQCFSGRRMNFVDFWSVTLQHRDVILACVLICRILNILKPRLICCMSDKVVTLLEQGVFLAPAVEPEFLSIPSAPSASGADSENTEAEYTDKESDNGSEAEWEQGEWEQDEWEPEDVAMAAKSDSESNSRSASQQDGIETKQNDEAKPVKSDTESDTQSLSEQDEVEVDQDDEAKPIKKPKPSDDGSVDDVDTESDTDELEWHDIAEGDFIIRCGTVSVRAVGAITQQQQEHFAVIVTTLDPGYFAYNPTYQQELHVLFALLGSLESLAESIVSKAESWSNTAAEAVVVEVRSIAEQTGLADQLQAQKAKVYELVSTISSIRKLAKPHTVKDFDLQSAIMQETRATVISRQLIAKGKANSAERDHQLEAIVKTGRKLETRLYKQGTDAWYEALRGVREGRYLGLSLNSKTGKSKPQGENMAHARAHIDPTTRTRNAAKRGVWPGYGGSNPTVSEALRLLSSVESLDPRRVSKTKPQAILCCVCGTCGAKGLVYKSTTKHFCGTTKGLSIVSSRSPVEHFKVLLPMDLYYSQFGQEVRQILQQSDAYKTTFDDKGNPDISCTSIIWTESGSAEQRKSFVQLQKAAVSLMVAGGRSFERVVKKVGGIYKKLAANAVAKDKKGPAEKVDKAVEIAGETEEEDEEEDEDEDEWVEDEDE